MIIDLKRFIQSREFDWRQLEDFLDRARAGGIAHLSLKETERFNLLYRTVSSDLNRLQTFSTDPDLVSYLESLVSRAFTQMYQVRRARQERGGRRLWRPRRRPRSAGQVGAYRLRASAGPPGGPGGGGRAVRGCAISPGPARGFFDVSDDAQHQGLRVRARARIHVRGRNAVHPVLQRRDPRRGRGGLPVGGRRPLSPRVAPAARID